MTTVVSVAKWLTWLIAALALVSLGGCVAQPASPADEAAIKAVVERSYIVRAAAACNGDIAALDEVFVNHPSYPLRGDWWRNYQEMSDRVAGRVSTPASPPGLLDYWRALYTYRRTADISSEMPSPTAVPVGCSDPTRKPILRYHDIEVQGDRATVRLDDGAYDLRLVLVKTPNGWRIAEDVPLELHF